MNASIPPGSEPGAPPLPSSQDDDANLPAGDAPWLRQPYSPVNILLIVASVAATLWTDWGKDVHRLAPLAISLLPANTPGAFSAIVAHGEIWRLFTPIFLHFSVAHLGFNMMGMVNLGGPMEKVNGSRSYLLLCLVLALLTNLGEYLLNGMPNFGGMSGVLYGLFGYIWLRARADRQYVLQMPKETIVIALVWFVACFTGALGPIGNAAHGAGLVIGSAWGFFAGRTATRLRERDNLHLP